MGLFSGLLGGTKTKVSTKQVTFDKKLPKDLQAPARGLAKSSLGLFQERTDAGESQEAASLFGASRARTLKDFQAASRQLSSGLHRAGAGGSTAARAGGVDLANALLGNLALMDTARADQLEQRRTGAAQAGIGGITQLAGAGTTIPIKEEGSPGLLGGLAGGLLSPIASGLGGSIAGVFGGGGGKGGGAKGGGVGSTVGGLAGSLFGPLGAAAGTTIGGMFDR
jgi:hypothetical protein